MTTICDICKREKCDIKVTHDVCYRKADEFGTDICHGHTDTAEEFWKEDSPDTSCSSVFTEKQNRELSELCLKLEREGWLAPRIFGELGKFLVPLLASEKQRLGEKVVGAVPYIDPNTCSQVFLKKVCTRDVCNKCDYRAANNAARTVLITTLRSEGVIIEE